MLVHRASRPVQALEGLVCFPDVMPSSQMSISVHYWALDFVIGGLSKISVLIASSCFAKICLYFYIKDKTMISQFCQIVKDLLKCEQAVSGW